MVFFLKILRDLYVHAIKQENMRLKCIFNGIQKKTLTYKSDRGRRNR